MAKIKKKTQEPVIESELLALGHLIKYNLYLLSKAIIFSSILENIAPKNTQTAADETNKIINELDLDTKQRLLNKQ